MLSERLRQGILEKQIEQIIAVWITGPEYT